jgi:type 1 glutamine amidotransferase
MNNLDDGSADNTEDTDSEPPDAAHSDKVLIYAVTTAYRHASIPAAARALTAAAAAVGLTTDVVGASDATNVVDASKFTAATLAQYGAVILLANDGEPFGYPATQEIQNLTDYVSQGGALVAVECATDCYGGGFSGPMDGHPASVPFHDLLGGTFSMHSALAPATCTKTDLGDHPSVAQLAPAFNLTDEIYAFSSMRMDDQVVLTCSSSTDPQTVRPIAWFRQEGLGRVFYSALGHPAESWTMPMDPKVPMSRLVQDLVLPGLLWAMQR